LPFDVKRCFDRGAARSGLASSYADAKHAPVTVRLPCSLTLLSSRGSSLKCSCCDRPEAKWTRVKPRNARIAHRAKGGSSGINERPRLPRADPGSAPRLRLLTYPPHGVSGTRASDGRTRTSNSSGRIRTGARAGPETRSSTRCSTGSEGFKYAGGVFSALCAVASKLASRIAARGDHDAARHSHPHVELSLKLPMLQA